MAGFVRKTKKFSNTLTLCTQLFFYCSAETKRNLFPTFLSSFRGVLLIKADQLNDLVKEKLVKTTVNVHYVFFTDDKEYTEQDYKNLIILCQQLNAFIVSCSEEKKASEFLSNFIWRLVNEFFLKREENNTHLYFMKIIKDEEEGIPFLAYDMIKALISRQETTKKTNMNGDESSEESSSSCCSKLHGLCRVRKIEAQWLDRSEVEQLSEMMPFITAPHEIEVWGEPGEVLDADEESLMGSIQPTHKLKSLILCRINGTSSLAVEFINSLFKKAPNLEWLEMSHNPLLGAGVDSVIQHLSCAPHLKTLDLTEVKMTPQQVKNVTSAVQQHGNITVLRSSYHVSFPILSLFVSLFFVYSLFLLSSFLSPYSFLCHFYARQNMKIRYLLLKTNHKL